MEERTLDGPDVPDVPDTFGEVYCSLGTMMIWRLEVPQVWGLSVH
jgi:hypothetical protein